jgi:DNA-binding SARP family transcriptional activator
MLRLLRTMSQVEATIHPILNYSISGQPERGLELYAALAMPTPEDARWAGACLETLERFSEAKDLLIRSRARGCVAAGIGLASVYRQLGDRKRAHDTLESIETASLTTFDLALAGRERGLLRLLEGDLEGATHALEDGWGYAMASEIGHLLRPALGHALAFTYQSRGLDVEAVHYYNTALQGANPNRRTRLHSSRALCYVYLGRYEEAEQDLVFAESQQLSSTMPTLTFHRATLHRARGQLEEALEAYRASARLARAAPEPDTEFYAELGACAVETARDRLGFARAHLARAKAVMEASGAKAKAILALREGALRARSGDPSSLEVLVNAVQQFKGLHLERESGWAWLHLAEAHLRLDQNEAAHTAMTHAADAYYATSASALALELPGVPAVLTYLASRPVDDYARSMLEGWQALRGLAPTEVRLVTLGATEVQVNGQRVGLELTRTVEIMSYLLRHPDSTKDAILAALFPDTDPRRAANYLHQARVNLKEAVPSLQIVYDRTRRVYRVRCEAPRFSWDVDDLQQLLSTAQDNDIERVVREFGGAFLPGADSDWAVTERDRLVWSVVKVGLQTLERWFEDGEYDKCLTLAEYLMELEPLNASLSEYLVNATLALEGEVAARRKLAFLGSRFLKEVGETPSELRKLERSLGSVN